MKPKNRVDIRSNVKGTSAIGDWDQVAQVYLEALVHLAGLDNLGWRAVVRDVHFHSKGTADAPPVVVRKWRDYAKSVELRIKGRRHKFEVDLSALRTDRPWEEVKAALLTAERMMDIGVTEEEAEKITESIETGIKQTRTEVEALKTKLAQLQTPEPPMNGRPDNQTPGEKQLLKLRDGIDKVLSVKRDMAATDELFAEADGRLRAAKKAEEPAKKHLDESTRSVMDLTTKAKGAKDEADRLTNLLRAAVDIRDKLARELESAAREKAEALTAHGPLAAKVKEAQAEADEIARAGAERAKTLEKAGDLSVLLAALEKLGMS